MEYQTPSWTVKPSASKTQYSTGNPLASIASGVASVSNWPLKPIVKSVAPQEALANIMMGVSRRNVATTTPARFGFARAKTPTLSPASGPSR